MENRQKKKKANRLLLASWLTLYVGMMPIVLIFGGFFSLFFYTMYCLMLLQYILTSPRALFSLSKSPVGIVLAVASALALLLYRNQMRSSPPDPLTLLTERRYSELQKLYSADWYNKRGQSGSSPLSIAVAKEADGATMKLLELGADPLRAWHSDESRAVVLERFATPLARQQIKSVLEEREQ